RRHRSSCAGTSSGVWSLFPSACRRPRRCRVYYDRPAGDVSPLQRPLPMGSVRNAITYVVTVPQSRTLLRGQFKHMRAGGMSASVVTSPGPEVAPFEAREGVPVHEVDMQRRVTPLLD